ncbi:MAG: ribonuclease P protein component [Parcubacteria bacterium C7867-008]|nr:MAG: ribonuclease P protein component [Parcubacteria bacterium C7867-008]
MLSRSNRLPRAGFEQNTGLRRTASRYFSMAYIQSAPISGGAVVVSKKVAKKSVDRHQLKRRIKAITKPWCVSGRVIIIHARPGAAELPFSEMEVELTTLLQQSFPSGTMEPT